MKPSERAALKRAIKLFPSANKFAEAIGVSWATPAMWQTRKGVPAEHCLLIERETRALGKPVVCEELRTDLPWDVLRQNSPNLKVRA